MLQLHRIWKNLVYTHESGQPVDTPTVSLPSFAEPENLRLFHSSGVGIPEIARSTCLIKSP